MPRTATTWPGLAAASRSTRFAARRCDTGLARYRSSSTHYHPGATHMPDTPNIVVTRDQAERLLALVDQANATTKNHVVSTLTTTIGTQDDRVTAAAGLPPDVEALTTLRANIAHRLNNTLAR